MAFISTPGPKEIYVKFNFVPVERKYYNGQIPAQFNQYGWGFVGTCVTAPEPEETDNLLDVFTDYSGPLTPFDTIYTGKTALIPITVNRMNLEVCRAMRDQPRHLGAFNLVGVDDALARGTFLVGKYDFQLLILNRYFFAGGGAGLPPNRSPQMSPGRKYFAASVAAYKESTVGTRVEEVSFVIKAYNVFVGIAESTDDLTKKLFKLYTEDPADPDFTRVAPN